MAKTLEEFYEFAQNYRPWINLVLISFISYYTGALIGIMNSRKVPKDDL